MVAELVEELVAGLVAHQELEEVQELVVLKEHKFPGTNIFIRNHQDNPSFVLNFCSSPNNQDTKV